MAEVRAHFVPIATGDVVLADAKSEIARHLRRSYDDASGSQRHAAEQAALVTVALLRKHRPREDSADSEEEPRLGGGGTTYGGDHLDFRGGTFHGPVIGKRGDGRG